MDNRVFVRLVINECFNAVQKYGWFNSQYELYGVLKQKIEEFNEAVEVGSSIEEKQEKLTQIAAMAFSGGVWVQCKNVICDQEFSALNRACYGREFEARMGNTVAALMSSHEISTIAYMNESLEMLWQCVRADTYNDASLVNIAAAAWVLFDNEVSAEF